ncbi:MAG TPA: hypothetical protein PKN95_05945 [Verrucomicrobiota bacterium]|nr:hypothetical protein [Verrucomicrobiota bacterium]HNT15440.1 hypothetical protein [Verrucomicrobiota bacterium]
MQLRYDEDFIETAVFCRAHSPPPSGPPAGASPTNSCRPPALQIARFHREREKCYDLRDPDARHAAFFQVHLDWFREWRLEQPLTEVVEEFVLVRGRLTTLAVRKATGRHDEGAELYVNETGERTGLLALRPERLLHRVTVRDFLRHEFMHLHDMLDPAFGYAPALDLPGLNAAQKRLARERYRLLWDITIDGRLAAAGHTPAATREQHMLAFDRGYSFWPEARRGETLDSLWRCPAPRHTDLLALIADPRGLQDAARPAPGGSCPLCEFPTFHWAVAATLAPAMLRRILAAFPAWQPEQGLCSRCLETYEASAALELAAAQ